MLSLSSMILSCSSNIAWKALKALQCGIVLLVYLIFVFYSLYPCVCISVQCILSSPIRPPTSKSTNAVCSQASAKEEERKKILQDSLKLLRRDDGASLRVAPSTISNAGLGDYREAYTPLLISWYVHATIAYSTTLE